MLVSRTKEKERHYIRFHTVFFFALSLSLFIPFSLLGRYVQFHRTIYIRSSFFFTLRFSCVRIVAHSMSFLFSFFVSSIEKKLNHLRMIDEEPLISFEQRCSICFSLKRIRCDAIRRRNKKVSFDFFPHASC